VSFWVKVCAVFFVSGVGSMILGTADQLFDLGFWHGAYPPVQEAGTPHEHATTYGQFMLYAGITALVSGLLGTFLYNRRIRRQEEALMLLQLFEESEDFHPPQRDEPSENESAPKATLAELERKYGGEK
jgi:hypothetical protein